MPQEIAKNKKQNGANVGFEETLWSAADKMRNNMDPAEYKHVVLGLFKRFINGMKTAGIKVADQTIKEFGVLNQNLKSFFEILAFLVCDKC